MLNSIKCGDAKQELKKIESNSINLIFTSPPYGKQRRNNYDSIPPDEYVSWFKPIADELYRVLDDTGSFVLNIKESVVDGERHTYVLDLIKSLIEDKEKRWYWIEEYIWYKKNSFPGKLPNRFRDNWERCIHFTKNKKFYMDQEAVMKPIGDWAKKRFSRPSKNDDIRYNSATGSGFGKRVSNWRDRTHVFPHNVLELATTVNDKNHSATFPIQLPEWFIRLFSKEGDTILDPFIGSGTTAEAAIINNRQYIGIDIDSSFCKLARENLKKQNKQLEKLI